MGKMQLPENIKSAGGSFEPIPAGVYDLRIADVKEEKPTKTSGDLRAQVGFIVAPGQKYAGRYVWEGFMTEGNGVIRTKALYQGVTGTDPTENLKVGATINPYDWLLEIKDQYVRTSVIVAPDQDGTPRNYVGGEGKSGGGFRFEPSPLNKKAPSKAAKKSPPSKAKK